MVPMRARTSCSNRSAQEALTPERLWTRRPATPHPGHSLVALVLQGTTSVALLFLRVPVLNPRYEPLGHTAGCSSWYGKGKNALMLNEREMFDREFYRMPG